MEFLVFLAAYLLGAIPFGVIAAKICGVDLFKIGSGSTGTTNVIRACGNKWGITVLILDVLKGTAATALGMVYLSNPWLIALCGVLAMVGHSASIFIKFRGGKSAATGAGILLALNWQIFVVVALLVILVRQITGYQSVASLTGALTSTLFFSLFQKHIEYTVIVSLGSLFVIIKHIPNIQRLIAGTETRIVKGKK